MPGDSKNAFLHWGDVVAQPAVIGQHGGQKNRRGVRYAGHNHWDVQGDADSG